MRSGDRGTTAQLLLGAGVLVLGLVLLMPLPPGLWHDDGVYLMLGRALAGGDGLAYVGLPGDPAAPKFPPLYPAVLAVLWWVTDNPYGVGQVAAVVNVAFVAGAAVAFAGWARALGAAWPTALGAGALIGCSVPLWQTAMVALSEPLFVLVMAGALALALRVEARGGTREALALAGVLLALVHVRTAGVALVGAAVVGLAFRRRFREAATVAVVCGVGMLPWLAFSGSATAALPEPLRDILGGYGGFLSDQVGEPGGLDGEVLIAAAAPLARSLAGLFLVGTNGSFGVALTVAVVAALAAAGGHLARRTPTGALALAFLVAEVWVWPFQATRLLVPVVPLAVVALACGVEALAVRWASHRHARPVVLALGCAAGAAFAVASGVRMAAGDVTDRYRIRTRTLAEALDLVERTPADAVVGAPELWAVLPMLSGRRSAPSAPFQPDPLGRRPTAGTPLDQLAVWEAAGVDHLLLEDGGRIHGGTLTTIENACPGTVTIVGRTEHEMLVRLGGDPACRRAALARGAL